MSTKSPAIVSIIIPVFNRATLLAESLNSILNQTYLNWECIIVDDHSIDSLEEVISDYLKADDRISFYRRPNSKVKGANSCRNFGLSKANGDFIYWLDSDDIIHPNLLKFSVEILSREPVDYVRFNRELFYGTFSNGFVEEQIKPGEFLPASPMLIENMLLNKIEYNTCNIVWRKNSLESEKFYENIIYADEWEYYLRLLVMGLKGLNLENTLIFGRKHLHSTTYEYRAKDPLRTSSKIKASFRVIDILNKNNLLSIPLIRYFIQLAFEIKSLALLRKILNATDANLFKKSIYELVFRVYPVLKPVFYLKGKILKS